MPLLPIVLELELVLVIDVSWSPVGVCSSEAAGERTLRAARGKDFDYEDEDEFEFEYDWKRMRGRDALPRDPRRDIRW